MIQTFDNGPYDQRFLETFAPSIEKGGATPVRADQVLGTRPVIEKIETGLRDADIAFCEASEDNSNVFLELGYALSLNVPTVIVCDRAKRSKLPFDISHRPVIFYRTQAQSDFEKLGSEITANVPAALTEAQQKVVISDELKERESDDIEEVIRLCLVEFLEQDLRSPDGATLWDIERRLAGGLINSRMVALATTHLVGIGYLERLESSGGFSDARTYSYRITDAGRTDLLQSYRKIMHTEFENLRSGRHLDAEPNPDEEIPF